jgi:cytochrome c biogenesis protein
VSGRPEGLVPARGQDEISTDPEISTGPESSTGPEEIIQPRLGPIGWLRWMWRQLTSMRTALLLLMLLAVAAIPGSVFPQNRIDPAKVQSYLADHPSSGPWLQRLGAFDVYSSPWFAAIYLLLFISLVGCVLPRARLHWRAVLAQPPRAPRRLERLPAYAERTVEASPDDVLAAARTVLRAQGIGAWGMGSRYRVAQPQDGDDAVSAERGHLAETGNLAFHLALLALLFTIATGSFVSYSGQAVVVEGASWSNTVVQYDSFRPGQAVDPERLPPFSLTLDALKVEFDSKGTGAQFGAPRAFEATVTYQSDPAEPLRRKVIEVNHPLNVDDAGVFLVGNGYAPVITVRDPDGTVVYGGPTPFVPTDGKYTSSGVLKVPDGLSKQLGIAANLLPTAALDPEGRPVSVFPGPTNPLLILTGFTGDLGLDDGVPQSVYTLDTTRLTQLTVGKEPFSASLQPGQRVDLPGGLGSVTFEGMRRYAAFDVRSDPTKVWVLIAAMTALIGLTVSLFVHRRRVWVRAVPDAQGRTVVQAGGLARREDSGLAAEITRLLDAVVTRCDVVTTKETR